MRYYWYCSLFSAMQEYRADYQQVYAPPFHTPLISAPLPSAGLDRADFELRGPNIARSFQLPPNQPMLHPC